MELEMTPGVIGMSLLMLGMLAAVGMYLRAKLRFTQRLFLPVALIAGLLALLLGPEVLGRIAGALGVESLEAGGLFGETVIEVWSTLPGILISVVFATMFLGSRIPSPKSAVRLLGPQLSLGITFASGQYVVGILAVLLILGPLFNVGPEFAALLEIGFEGGHGTAAGLQSQFESLGFDEGYDLALSMATVGLVSGILFGVAAVNWAARKGVSTSLDAGQELSLDERIGYYAAVRDEDRPAAGRLTFRDSAVESFTIHLGVVGLAVLIGWLGLAAFQWVEEMLWIDTIEIFGHVPLFPLAMLGGVLVQMVLDRSETLHGLVNRGMMERIQGVSLDLLIIAALAALSLQAVADNLAPFAILAALGIVWNLVVLFVFAPKFIRTYWFERGIADYGQSQGVTATGLLLLRMATRRRRPRPTRASATSSSCSSRSSAAAW
ncbi:sodium/glutamate symporter [Micrococcus lylae]|uniref:sodium/glutamate symporter n=1 Tax=Micrococcus lylae TaxID=1273 RepID=UPI001FD791E5|nr:sodium/glutamate symporter [Micrococcus lylae]